MPSKIFLPRHAAVLAILFLGTTGIPRAACDNCPQRSVTLYDFDVTVPRPDSLADMAAWYSLFYAGPGAASAIFTPQCARFIDGSFYRDGSGVPSNSLTVGIDHPNTAPAGALKGMDYLLNGSVSRDGSGYEVTMALECACSRQQVITASAHFDDPDQASAAAGDLARRNFIPVADKIRDFERDARDEDPEVSIGGYNSKLVLDPIRRKASMGEKVPVTLTLTDCDGEPLGGRKIALTGSGADAPASVNGSFAASEATTGDDGKVTVDFTVGSARGTALARAYFFHKTPFGCKAVAVDEAAIDVEGSAKFYQVRYQYEETYDMDFSLFEQLGPNWTKNVRRTDYRKTVFSGSAVFENLAHAFGGEDVELEGAGLEGGLTNGSYEQAIHFTGNENFSDANATIRYGNYEDRKLAGSPDRSGTEQPDFFVSLVPDELEESSQFSFTIPFSIQGHLSSAGFRIIRASGQSFDSSWTDADELSEETLLSPSVSMLNHYSLKDSVFRITGFLDTNWTADNIRTRLWGKFNATVTPIALRPNPNGTLPRQAPSRRQARIRTLNGGSLVACGLQDVPPGTRVRVELRSLRGELLSVLHDAPKGPERELRLAVGKGGNMPGPGLSAFVFRAGKVRESRVLYR